MPFLAHFGLKERPFALTPNSALYFPSEAHQQVLNSLTRAIDRGEAVVKVSGEVGTGKTLLCHLLAAKLIDSAAVACIVNPQSDSDWVIGAVCREFGLDPDGADDPLHGLNAFLLERFEAGRRIVLVVDEAQALGLVGLETVRRLSNLETDKSKLLQTVLFGQPELDRLLESPALRQLNQRIVFSLTIPPLSPGVTAQYIHHRVRRSMADGANPGALFDSRATRAIARASRGIPRVTNIIADKSLLAAYGQGAALVTARHVRDAVNDSREVIASLPGAGGWGRRALDALSRWMGDGGRQPHAPAPEPPPEPASEPSHDAPPAGRSDITVGDAADAWLAHSARERLTPAALAERRRHVETFIKPAVGAVTAAQLTPEAVEAFAAKLARSRPPDEALSVLASLEAILKDAVRRGHWPRIRRAR